MRRVNLTRVTFHAKKYTHASAWKKRQTKEVGSNANFFQKYIFIFASAEEIFSSFMC